MKTFVWILLSSPLWLALGALLLNRPPLFDSPGALERLRLYLSSNVAQTAADHAHPELRTPQFAEPPEVLAPQVAASMVALGWQVQHSDLQRVSAEIECLRQLAKCNFSAADEDDDVEQSCGARINGE